MLLGRMSMSSEELIDGDMEEAHSLGEKIKAELAMEQPSGNQSKEKNTSIDPIHKQNLKRLIIIFIIFFAVMCVILIYLHFSQQPIINNLENDKQKLDEKVQSIEQNIPINPTSEEQIKLEIVTGKRQDVPPEIGESKDMIIRDYLYNCYLLIDNKEKLDCYTQYNFNDNMSVAKDKNYCMTLSVNEKTECLDALYYKIGTELEQTFCFEIINIEMREECASFS
jgi:preprotein translocase subunit SecG